MEAKRTPLTALAGHRRRMGEPGQNGSDSVNGLLDQVDKSSAGFLRCGGRVGRVMIHC